MRVNLVKRLPFVATIISLGCLASATTFSADGELSLTKITQDETNKSSRVFSNLNFSSKAAGFSEGEDSASLVLFGISPSFKFEYGSQFYINADATLNLSSSRTQSRYVSYADNNFVLNDLSINYAPAKIATISLGALNQSHLNSPFLLSSLSFPGASVKAEKKFSKVMVGLKAQNLIPTSNSLDSDRTSKEALPNLQTQGLYSELSLGSSVVVGGQVNKYKFSDLPAVVAYESKRLGNTVTGIEVGDSHFSNEFSGVAQSYFADIKYGESIEQKVLISILENENVSAGSNRAQLVETYLSFALNNEVDVVSGIGFFYAESDAAPAYYNSSSLGHNNRKGQRYSLKTVFKRMNLSAQISFIDARVINTSVYQDDLSSVELSMEMLNVKF